MFSFNEYSIRIYVLRSPESQKRGFERRSVSECRRWRWKCVTSRLAKKLLDWIDAHKCYKSTPFWRKSQLVHKLVWCIFKRPGFGGIISKSGFEVHITRWAFWHKIDRNRFRGRIRTLIGRNRSTDFNNTYKLMSFVVLPLPVTP